MLRQNDEIHIVDARLLEMSNGIKEGIDGMNEVRDTCSKVEFNMMKVQLNMLKDVFWMYVKKIYPELERLMLSPKYVELSHDCINHVIKVEKVSDDINDGMTIDDILDDLGLDRPSLN